MKHQRGAFTLRFVQRFADLWGALVLLRELPVPHEVGPQQVSFRCSPVTLKFPNGFQEGFGVSFNELLFFLPSDKCRNTAAEAGKLAGQLALAVVGVTVTTSRAKRPYALWLWLWQHVSPEHFESLLHEAVELRGGQVVPFVDLRIESPNRAHANDLVFAATQPLFA